jgi:myo-inositol-1(or 4)-monophosphatase
MLSSEALQSLIAVALRASEAAAAVLTTPTGEQGDAPRVNDDEGRDIKLEMDLLAEKAILNHLTSASPYAILSEESGVLASKSSRTQARDEDYVWIVDPLDGTYNYFRGIPLCCISIAFFRGNHPLFGIVNDFNHADIYVGIVGSGAQKNGAPISVSGVAEKSQAVLCTGLPVASDFSHQARTRLVADLGDFKKVRMIGSAALSLALVACGKADYYWENKIALWDVAAGIALVEAAGGKVEMGATEDRLRRDVRASNGRL